MKFVKRAFRKMKSWYQLDANGRTNKVAITIFFGFLFLPVVFYLGIKVGIYSMTMAAYDKHVSKFVLLMQGAAMPLKDVLALKEKAESLRFNGTFTITSFDFSYLLVLLICYGFVWATSFVAADRNKNKSYKKDGWMEFGNIDEFNRAMAYPPGAEDPEDPPENSYEPGNMILSEHVRYDLEPKGTNTYSCALVVGATGSGKSFTYVKPNVLQMNSSYVVTDPKGELTESLGKALLEHGYDVKVFNTDEPIYSCKYNPFKYIRNEAGVVTLTNVFLENTKQSDAGAGDPFFPLAEKNFYLMIFFYIYTVYKDRPEKQNFKTVYEIYQMADEQEVPLKRGEVAPQSPLDEMFKKLAKEDPTNPSLAYYATFKKGSARTKQSILISAGVKLWFMMVPEIANLMSDDTLHLETIGDRKSALFAIIPTQDDKYRFLSAMLFTQLFEVLYHIGNTLNPSSWLLTKGNCVALRSAPFVQGTDSAQSTLEDLKKKQALWSKAEIEDDNELMEKDPELKRIFKTPDKDGIRPWPKTRLVVKENGKRVVLEEFNSRAAAEIVLDAVKNGEIIQGEKSLTCHVRFVLDEFFNIGKIDGFDMKIATFRSLRISADIVVQSIAQLKEMYEDREGKITSNCSIVILLGANSMDDCEWFSDLCGQTTIKSESMNVETSGIMQGTKGGTVSDNAMLLIRPEQIRTMQKDECIVLVNTKMPIKDKKYAALKHPRWKETFVPKKKGQMENEFQYKRIFHIVQRDENLVVTQLHSVVEEAAAMAIEADKKKEQQSRTNTVQPQPMSQAKVVATIPTEFGVKRERKRKGDPTVYESEKKKAQSTSLVEKITEKYRDYMLPPDGRIPADALDPEMYKRMEAGLLSGELEIKDGMVVINKKGPSLGDMMDGLM